MRMEIFASNNINSFPGVFILIAFTFLIGFTSAIADELTIKGTFQVSDKPYDGTTDATIIVNNLLLDGIEDDDEVFLTGVVAEFSQESVGTGITVIIIDATLEGEDADDYDLEIDEDTPTTTANISGLELTIGGSFTVYDKDYDGTTDATIDEDDLTLEGVIEDDEGDVELTDVVIEFQSPEAGEQTVNITGAKITGDQAGNYSLSLDGAPTAEAVIILSTQIIVGSGYNAANGQLQLSAENLATDQEIDVTKLTISNGSDVFTLTGQTPNVYPSSANEATIVVQGTDKAYVNWIFNDNGSRSINNQLYNLAAAENWHGPAPEDPVNSVSVFNHIPPSLVSSTYNRETGGLDVTASRLVAAPDPVIDIDATKFTISGKGGDSHTLTSTTPDVNVMSDSRFIIFIEGDDKEQIDLLLDIGGTNASTGHSYNLAVSHRWNRPSHPSNNISDPTGVSIEAQEIPNQPPVASDVTIEGEMIIGETITGKYTYYDPEGDPEDDSEYAWFRADNQAGTGAAIIDGEDDIDYTLENDDFNKYIAFEVTPGAGTGTSPGEPVRSSYMQVKSTISSADLTGTTTICYGEEATLTITLTGTGPWTVVYDDGQTEEEEDITSSPHQIKVTPETTTTYTLVSVEDYYGVSGTASGEAVITVDPLPAGGNVSGGNTEILLTQPTGTMTLSGQTGTVLRWERRVNGGSWTEIVNSQTTYSETPATTGTYQYRAVVGSGACGTDNSTHHQIVVSGSPVLGDAEYNAANGHLTLYGQLFDVGEEIDVTSLTLSNGANEFTLTGQTPNVFPLSATRATIVVLGTDKAYMNWIFNNNGSRSKDNQLYNLAAAENWNGRALEIQTTPVSVTNHAPPSIIFATYNMLTAELDVSASGLVAAPGSVGDIDATKLTISGRAGDSYTLTSATPDVNVLSDRRFIIYIEGVDKVRIDQLLDIEGNNASTGHPYNLSVANRWNRPVHNGYNIVDPAGVSMYIQNIPNQPPVATNVKIEGELIIGETITGYYDYSDLEGDEEGNSIYVWYRANNAEGAGESVIGGEAGIRYTLTSADKGKYLAFEVTPVAESGIQKGNPVKSSYTEVLNVPPTVSDVVIDGVTEVCKVLEADYDYSDLEGDPEGNTEIKWFRADDDSGTNELKIHEGAEYTLLPDDEDKYIRTDVTPVASTGTSPGITVSSDYYGPVENMLPTVSIAGSGEFCEGSSENLVFSLTGRAPWTVFYTDGSDEFSFTASSSPYTLSTGTEGSYRVTMLTDADGCEGTELGGHLLLTEIPTVRLLGDWYGEDFDVDKGFWESSAPGNEAVNSWVYGPPDGDVFTSASAGANFWYTNIINNGVAELSMVTGPCFDFRQVIRPMILIDMWKEFDNEHEGAVLQYTEDNGATWHNIGGAGTGINWYNATQISGMPGGQPVGWASAGTTGDGQWVESRHDMDMLAGKDNVRLRLAYGSDGQGADSKGFAFDNIRIAGRTRLVLLEHFTNAPGNNSIEANNIVNSIARNKPNDVATISYHTDFHESDPINSQNSADPAARVFYYGISSVPYSLMDGGISESWRYDYSDAEFNEQDLLLRSLYDPVFAISIDQAQAGDQFTIDVDITSLLDQGPVDMTLHVVMVETEIEASLVGIDGDHVYRNVVRKLLPDAGGTQLPGTWATDQTEEYSFSWTIENIYNAENLAVVVFIQDEISQEIYQAETSPNYGAPISVIPLPDNDSGQGIVFYPNPASDKLFISFSEPLTNQFVLEVYNIAGSVVYSDIIKQGETLYEFNTRQFSRGTYIFGIKDDKGIKASARVLIMRK